VSHGGLLLWLLLGIGEQAEMVSLILGEMGVVGPKVGVSQAATMTRTAATTITSTTTNSIGRGCRHSAVATMAAMMAMMAMMVVVVVVE